MVVCVDVDHFRCWGFWFVALRWRYPRVFDGMRALLVTSWFGIAGADDSEDNIHA